MKLSAAHRRTWRRIVEGPAPADLRWSDIEALMRALGAEISEGSGSRVRFALNGVRAVFHRPHPSPDTKRGAVRALREFLVNASVHVDGGRDV